MIFASPQILRRPAGTLATLAMLTAKAVVSVRPLGSRAPSPLPADEIGANQRYAGLKLYRDAFALVKTALAGVYITNAC